MCLFPAFKPWQTLELKLFLFCFYFIFLASESRIFFTPLFLPYSVFCYYSVSTYPYVMAFFSLTTFLAFLTKFLLCITIQISCSNFYFFVRINYRWTRQLHILQKYLKPCSEKNLISERHIRTNLTESFIFCSLSGHVFSLLN